jgi:phosphoenolpyruvate carboxykinase (ATP)
MPRHPVVYAEMLGEKMAEHKAPAFLVSTGVTGGPYGEGERFKIAHSRAAVRAAIAGELDNVDYRTDPVFGFEVPMECPNLPSELLWPRDTWRDSAAYDAKANELGQLFAENFAQFESEASLEVGAAGPRV